MFSILEPLHGSPPGCFYLRLLSSPKAPVIAAWHRGRSSAGSLPWWALDVFQLSSRRHDEKGLPRMYCSVSLLVRPAFLHIDLVDGSFHYMEIYLYGVCSKVTKKHIEQRAIGLILCDSTANAYLNVAWKSL